MKIVKMNEEPLENKSGNNVINMLEEALAMAKDGHVSNVVVLATLHDGSIMDCWANSSEPFLIVGGLESLKLDFMQDTIDRR
jgi:hypothetical protein